MVKILGIGLIGIFGAEWFATDAISFDAEYRARAKYTRTKNESDRIRDYNYGKEVINTENSYEDWNFDASIVTFGVSLYF
ncbi:MAG: hypothetical protein GF417_02915 [Candidatus Latescibacteria bacterium]|nr:hypothetical protein [bacterium]MBD3423379.1 hypothetical protein [Candidatus Latescibacterota bacterium]